GDHHIIFGIGLFIFHDQACQFFRIKRDLANDGPLSAGQNGNGWFLLGLVFYIATSLNSLLIILECKTARPQGVFSKLGKAPDGVKMICDEPATGNRKRLRLILATRPKTLFSSPDSIE
ncbi:MAG: hypothetical protein B6240_09015, partial [Desulfobacteraceae bacterium 4572_87]